jgi:hypothetical protein
MMLPRSRGMPTGLLGQSLYGWLGGATIVLEAVSTAFCDKEGRLSGQKKPSL